MPRRAEIQPRQLEADSVYGSVLVTQVINCVMLDGKKSTAERIVYDALALLPRRPASRRSRSSRGRSRPSRPCSRCARAASVAPTTRCRSRCRSAAPARSRSAGSSSSRATGARSTCDKLAGELMDALNQQGGAFKKKDDIYRMAQANKAFAHYRW